MVTVKTFNRKFLAEETRSHLMKVGIPAIVYSGHKDITKKDSLFGEFHVAVADDKEFDAKWFLEQGFFSTIVDSMFPRVKARKQLKQQKLIEQLQVESQKEEIPLKTSAHVVSSTDDKANASKVNINNIKEKMKRVKENMEAKQRTTTTPTTGEASAEQASMDNLSSAVAGMPEAVHSGAEEVSDAPFFDPTKHDFNQDDEHHEQQPTLT